MITKSINDILEENGLWFKKSPQEAKSFFKALSNAIYFSNKRADFLQELILLKFLNNFEHFMQFHDFQSFESVENFLNNPQMPQFHTLLFEVAADCFRRQIKLYFTHEGFLFTDYFGKKTKKSLNIIRVYDNHFSAVFKKEKAGIIVETQNIVLNLIETALNFPKKTIFTNLNQGFILNFEFEDWQRSLMVRKTAPNGLGTVLLSNFNRTSDLRQVNTFLLKMMHQRTAGDLENQKYNEVETECWSVGSKERFRNLLKQKFKKLIKTEKAFSELFDNIRDSEELDYEELLHMETKRLAQLTDNYPCIGFPNDPNVSPNKTKIEILAGGFLTDYENGKNESKDESQKLKRFENAISKGHKSSVSESQEMEKINFSTKKVKSKLVFNKNKQFDLKKPQGLNSNLELLVQENKRMARSALVNYPFIHSSPNETEDRKTVVFNSVNSKLNSEKGFLSAEILDPIIYIGELKFFDYKGNFGFLSTVANDEEEDIFAYGSEFEGSVAEFLRLKNPASGPYLVFEFQICSYFGKYKKSKKAMNIKLIEGQN